MIGVTSPGKQTWPSRFNCVQWTTQRPQPKQLYVEYNKVEDIKDWLCQGVPRIAIVGTRELSPWGAQFIENMVERIASWDMPAVIISGMCTGADETAHRAALTYGLPTIGVLPVIGFSRLRDLQEQIMGAGGFMLSEFPKNHPWDRSLYLQRDGITTALADIVIPIQARHRGGTWATINRAASQKKPIWCPNIPPAEYKKTPEVFDGLLSQKAHIEHWFTLNMLDDMRTLLERSIDL